MTPGLGFDGSKNLVSSGGPPPSSSCQQESTPQVFPSPHIRTMWKVMMIAGLHTYSKNCYCRLDIPR